MPKVLMLAGLVSYLVLTNGCSSQKDVVHMSEVPPVYNALFFPTSGSSSQVLVDKTRTTARFFIGLPDSRNAITGENWTVNPAILAEKENIPLVVTLICPFCSGLHVQKQAITYFGSRRASTEAQFEFVPLRAKIRDASGNAKMAFQITRRGVLCDYVPVNVAVTGSVTDSPANAPRTFARGTATLQGAVWARDIDLTLSMRASGNTIQVQLEPGVPQLDLSFARRHLDKDGALRWFNTGLKVNEVPRIVGRFYLQLNATINNNGTLKTALAGSSIPPRAAPSDVLLTGDDEKLLLDLLAKTGGAIYRALFVTGADGDLRALMEEFRRYSHQDRVVRLRVESDGIYFPWQILVPSGSSNSQEFWGFRYELSVNPTGITLPGPYKGPLKYKEGPLVFGEYRGDLPNDAVAKLAAMELRVLQKDMGLQGIVSVDSRDMFLQRLQSSRRSIQMLLTFTHAESGTTIKDNGEISEDVAGPKLQFAKNEFVPVGELANMLADVPVTEDTVFSSNPIVFLNGCETGTSGFYATTNQDFAGTFLRLGSRGVIVTEAPVWTFFGYNFGVSLIRQLATGDSIALALWQTRNDYLTRAHNPLGLLYSYYGGADVAVQFQ